VRDELGREEAFRGGWCQQSAVSKCERQLSLRVSESRALRKCCRCAQRYRSFVRRLEC